ncbi:hypothetical protein [Arthrobacter sp. M4]|uniref:hypothetical protein n=1 Tax=Arthrobacter sp. M4 TaxID=218160 RepID=UPI001CDD63D9|nr:hypothetical protein [Arthrobacter sp. M4]MCA4135367.1 hypothetical protein [Arthrobacter sp. M4]
MTQPSQGPIDDAGSPASPAPSAHTGEQAQMQSAQSAPRADESSAKPDSQPSGLQPSDPKLSGSQPSASQRPASQQASGSYQAIVGPFTYRDLAVFGSTLLLFIASLLPMFGGRVNLWGVNNLFFLGLGILLPITVSAMFVARRLQPTTIIRVGSLSIDQFASVVASFAFALYFLTTAVSFGGSALLGLIGALGLFASTVLGPHIPYLSVDFKDRVEVPAHVVAREAVVPTRKPAVPKAPKPAKEQAAKAQTAKSGGWRGALSGALGGTGAGAAGAGAGAAGAGAGAGASAAGAGAVGTGAGAAGAGAGAGASAAGVGAVGTGAGAAAAPEAATVGAASGPAGRPDADATQASAVVPSAGVASGGASASSAAPSAGSVGSSPADALPPTTASPVVPSGGQSSTREPQTRIGATVDPSSRVDEDHGPHYEAFWFAVAQPRTAVDEHSGAPVFTIEPGGWVLALEDRGHEFLVQHSDGRVGVLRDLSHIERG